MNYKNKSSIWEDLREVLSHVNIKTYIYAILVLGVLFAILINVKGESKYGHLTKDGKFTLDIENVARDYGLDINNENSTQSIDYGDATENNFTEDLSRSLFLTNLYLEQNGLTDPTARGKVLAGIILNYQNQVSGKIYTEANLSIIRDETKLNVEEYFKEIKSAFDRYTSNMKAVENSKPNLEQYATQQDIDQNTVNNAKSDIDNYINKLIANNKTLIDDLLSIPATQSGAVYQLQFINLFAKQNSLLRSLSQIETDPAKYLVLDGENSINNFEDDFTNINQSFGNYFTKFGIKN